MRILTKVSDLVYAMEKVLAIIFGGIILFSLSAGVLYRYVLSAPLLWSDEVAIFSLIWLTFIGGSMGIKRQDSAAVSVFIDKLKGRAKQIAFAIGVLILLVFIAYIFYLSIGWLSSPNISVQRSSSMGMPMIYAYLSVPVSFIFMTIHSLELFLSTVQDNQKRDQL